MFGKHFELNAQTLSVVEELGRHMPGGFFIYQAAQPETLLYANRACLDIFGCADLEEFKALTGFTFKGMLCPEDYAAVSASIVEQVEKSDDNFDYVEFRIVRRDGSLRWVDDYGHYTETEAYGGIYYVFISDITEKHEKQEKDTQIRDAVIQTLTTGYHTVWLINDVETETVSLYHTDMDDAHADATQSVLRHAKYSDGIAEYVDTMVAPEDRERMREALSLPYIRAQLETRERFSMTFLRALESGPRYYRVDLGRVYMPGGRLGVMIGFLDVDEEVRRARAYRQALEARVALQEELLEQEKLRKEQDAMITAMASDYRSVYHVDIDNDDAVCYRADTRYDDETPVGEHFPFHERFAAYCEACVDAEYREGFLRFIDPAHIREALATEAIIAYRYLVRAHGREYYEMLRMAGVRRPGDRDDHIVHAVGVGFTEIDAEMRESLARNRALREALAAAEQANRAKTAFLSNMSHEIRTPMNAIIGLNNIALNEPDVPEKIADYLRKMGESAQHLLGIINDILDMSRIESGRMVIKNEEFSFSKGLEQVNAIVAGQCREKGLHYECRTVGRIDDYYVGDGMKLRQVLINILGNAVKFTPEGGSVSFRIEEGPRFGGKATLVFTVRDTGIGMSRDFLPRIFEAFSQEDSSTTSRYGSTGLGLPITRSIVELMNGTISVESEKGVGSTFTVTVTLGESARKNGSMAESEIRPDEMSVLVIDDDTIALEHAEIVLAQAGVHCETAASGAAGVELVRVRHARHEDYDLVLVDWRMPDMDGVETTRQIRAIVGGATPIIILTSFNWDEIADEARLSGVDAFVAKPLFAGSVLDEFREAFKRKKEAAAPHASLKGRRVLLAEDVPVNAEIMSMVLSMREIEVDLAENGRIAVELFSRFPEGYYDAILMDMRMPEMDGLEATRAIRASGRADAKTIPIIALTANAFDEDVQRSLQAGLNAHLSKPVEADVLFDTLESLIRP